MKIPYSLKTLVTLRAVRRMSQSAMAQALGIPRRIGSDSKPTCAPYLLRFSTRSSRLSAMPFVVPWPRSEGRRFHARVISRFAIRFDPKQANPLVAQGVRQARSMTVPSGFLPG
ncbi:MULTISPECIES: hypothetical protein [Burkholderia cepacia complex]|uniref:hypothetical protein n=1 Tax=Burkholderia cepacia complex TaxID=87882 RepID=UPI0013DD8BD2|nr:MULTISPECIES: hypothetical protein [Burkholderia cepacia complex]